MLYLNIILKRVEIILFIPQFTLFAGGVVFLYKNPLEEFAKSKKFFVELLAVISVCSYFIIGANTFTLLFVCVMFLLCALGIERNGILINPVTTFISSISFEIYLCHMMIYRAIEKLNFTHLVSNDVVSYVITCIGTILGSVFFAVITQYLIDKTKGVINTSIKVFRRN